MPRVLQGKEQTVVPGERVARTMANVVGQPMTGRVVEAIEACRWCLSKSRPKC